MTPNQKYTSNSKPESPSSEKSSKADDIRDGAYLKKIEALIDEYLKDEKEQYGNVNFTYA